MQRQAVTSSNIKSIGWDGTGFDAVQKAEIGTLEVEFLNGSIYQYADVPRAVHARLTMTAASKAAGPSVGTLFDSLVKKGEYPATKIQGARARAAQQPALDMQAGAQAYHAHLDTCEQCRNNPFQNCPEGARLLVASVQA